MGRTERVTEPGLVYHVLNRRGMRLPHSVRGRVRKDRGNSSSPSSAFRQGTLEQIAGWSRIRYLAGTSPGY